MIKYFRLLLFPFSILYGLVVLVRNKLYDIGLLKSTRFNLPVICVGNLVVGGSGKSPLTEYLVQLLQGKKIAILSRGYGRETKGYILADATATAKSIGDEPMQFYHKFPQVTVAVCEDRVKGIRRLEADHDVIILDDAFQHRSVQAGFNVLLFEFQKLLSFQLLLPAGNLREPFKGYKRAQAVLITKGPEHLTTEQKNTCKTKFRKEMQEQVAFSFLQYQQLNHLFTKQTIACNSISENSSVFLLTGIANPAPLLSYLKRYTNHIHHHNYPDHYQFTRQDVQQLVTAFKEDATTEKIIITTEKDAQRLLGNTLEELLLDLPFFYLPIKIAIQEEDKATFDQKILDYVSSTTRNR